MSSVDRRHFLGMAALGIVSTRARPTLPAISPPPPPSASFPRQDAMMVEEFVRVAHADLARTKQLAEAHPALVKASYDWGFGDWEDALGAASHIGRRDIAEYLMSRGARPTIFSAAMLGDLATVKAMLGATAEAGRALGPHSISLLAHARAGGAAARATFDYLASLGLSDRPNPPLPADAAARYVGTYQYGAAPEERLVVAVDPRQGLTISSPRLSFGRSLRHVGDHSFFPVGAESVRVTFRLAGERASSLDVADDTQVVTAIRL